MRPVTEASREQFRKLGLNEFDNLGLISIEIGGVEADCIFAGIADPETGTVEITPIAVLLNDALFERVTPPEGVMECLEEHP